MTENVNEQDLDFNTDEYNSFYYTSEKHIKKMDDDYILSKISEKYPDIKKDTDENILKQAMIVMMNDTRFIQEFEKEYDISAKEIFTTLYRNYEFIFSKCFVSKIQSTVKNRKYAKRAVRKGKYARRGTKRITRKSARKSSKVF